METPTTSQWARFIIASLRRDATDLTADEKLWTLCLNTGFLGPDGKPRVSCCDQVSLALAKLKLNAGQADSWLAQLHTARLVEGEGASERFTIYDLLKWPKLVLQELQKAQSTLLVEFLRQDTMRGAAALVIILDGAEQDFVLLQQLCRISGPADSLRRLGLVAALLAESAEA